MKDLDEHGKMCEEEFGLISGYFIFELHQHSTAAGSKWEYDNPETMDIVINKHNAQIIYELCKEIRLKFNAFPQSLTSVLFLKAYSNSATVTF